MFQVTKNIAAILVLAMLAAGTAQASDTLNEVNQRIGAGDPVNGRAKSGLCQGCHGEDGNSISSAYPKLSGQWSDYVQKQFRNFQNLARVNETMNEVAVTITDFKDLFDIAAYFAAQKMMTGIQIQSEEERNLFFEGEKLYLTGDDASGAFRCIMCHGIRGKGEPLNNNLFPVIGGQHKDYLIKQLNEFRSGFRGNDPSGMMARITSHLSDRDIEALAIYLSREPQDIPPEAEVVAEPVTPPPVFKKFSLEEKPMRIDDSNFEKATATLKPSAFSQLNEVIEFAKSKPEADLAVVGHTDTVGSLEKNIALSNARAESIKNYLVDKGVAAARITAKGEGPSSPIADNKTAAGRAKNRRVEISAVIKEQKEVPAAP